ncbi:unnamed protein product [Medioppia subpectinata]|uniref:Inner centromere protein ARK-binding domain-containing protein n=1 Tax=Medioppia subpectinata TaxID=1979941 RepID=A0A7R9KX48_9ACAR|nr:unnamed protein product [Medioppia subpectinata]CAG2110404.1 unnamed protein product [Medioppia subpectinata]
MYEQGFTCGSRDCHIVFNFGRIFVFIGELYNRQHTQHIPLSPQQHLTIDCLIATMGTFVANDDHYVISGHTSDKVVHEWRGLVSAHNEMIAFIIESAKQMAEYIQTDINDSRVLRTPSRARRLSKRKRSSAATARHLALNSSTCKKRSNAAAVALKTRDPSVAVTPRRLSKRAKRSTIQLDTTVDEMMDTTAVASKVAVDVTDACVKSLDSLMTCVVSNHKISVEMVDIEDENRPPVMTTKANEIRTEDIDSPKLLTASEMMSELSISEDTNKMVNKLNESENEWMTDDEDCPASQKTPKKDTEVFFDAKNGTKKSSTNVSLINKTLNTSSAAKETRKKSLYFTPQTTQRSTRAQTRMLSRIADSSQKTPQVANRLIAQRESAAATSGYHSGGGATSGGKPMTAGCGSSARSVRSYSRVQQPGGGKAPDTKSLTDSAMKKRLEAEDQRRQRLMASQEKEKRAIEKRRILIEQSVSEKKQKSQEKANRAAELRELNAKKESERLRKEQERREEWERKREEERRELLRRKHEELQQKTRETERRKQLQEQKEMEAQMRRREELSRKQEAERERQREQERMAALIQHHNNSLQQKAMANSFIKKCAVGESSTTVAAATAAVTQPVPKVVLTKLSPELTAKHMPPQIIAPKEPTPIATAANRSPVETAATKSDPNQTYTKPDAPNETYVMDTSSYDMTPPPKEHSYDNYDISQIASDDDTDDDQQPRKRIPGWARGHMFIKQVHQQYSRPYKELYKEIKGVFGSGDALLNRFKVEFELMFPKRPIHPKYAKRTSSAVWDEPPARYRQAAGPNESLMNETFT